jgi:CRISPR-associated endoribonuclease Cas6
MDELPVSRPRRLAPEETRSELGNHHPFGMIMPGTRMRGPGVSNQAVPSHRASAGVISPESGRSLPAKSASVQVTRMMAAVPLVETWPTSMAWSREISASGRGGNERCSAVPGTSAFTCHGVPASQSVYGTMLRPAGSPEAWEWRAAWLPDGLPPTNALTADVLQVGHVSCSVEETRQRRTSYAALASGPPLTAATITFASPTYFSQNGADTVIPDPRLIAGSWRRRWNASLPQDDPLAITNPEWTATHNLLSLAAYNLHTEHRDTGHARDRPGFTGTATLRLPKNAPTATRKIFATLTRFAEYCGTGAQTTHGFGATTVTSADADR